MNTCIRCLKTVYPMEKLSCLDQFWHRTCFKCEVCNLALSMEDYKGYNKKPYFSAHCPQTKVQLPGHGIPVVGTPEDICLQGQDFWKQTDPARDEPRPGTGSSLMCALHDYAAADDDEVSFNEGDVIVDVERIDEGWVTGTVQRTGKTGMIPANYLEPV